MLKLEAETSSIDIKSKGIPVDQNEYILVTLYVKIKSRIKKHICNSIYQAREVMIITTEQSRDVAKKLLEVMATGNTTCLNDLLAEDATMTINLPLKKPYGGTFNGRKEIVEGFIQRSMQLVKEGGSLELRHIIVEESKVAIEWTNPINTSASTIHNCSALMEIINNSITYINVYVNT